MRGQDTPDPPRLASAPSVAWMALMAALGLGFGLLAEKRPFGEDLFAHPLLVLCALALAVLLALRVYRRRPVPDIVPERALVIGCLLAVVMFLIGNFTAVHVFSIR